MRTLERAEAYNSWASETQKPTLVCKEKYSSKKKNLINGEIWNECIYLNLLKYTLLKKLGNEPQICQVLDLPEDPL